MGNNRTVKPKEPRIAVRVSAELKQRLEAAQEQTGLDEPSIVRASVDAFCKYVEDHLESPPFPLEFRKPGQKTAGETAPVRYPPGRGPGLEPGQFNDGGGRGSKC